QALARERSHSGRSAAEAIERLAELLAPVEIHFVRFEAVKERPAHHARAAHLRHAVIVEIGRTSCDVVQMIENLGGKRGEKPKRAEMELRWRWRGLEGPPHGLFGGSKLGSFGRVFSRKSGCIATTRARADQEQAGDNASSHGEFAET